MCIQLRQAFTRGRQLGDEEIRSLLEKLQDPLVHADRFNERVIKQHKSFCLTELAECCVANIASLYLLSMEINASYGRLVKGASLLGVPIFTYFAGYHFREWIMLEHPEVYKKIRGITSVAFETLSICGRPLNIFAHFKRA